MTKEQLEIIVGLFAGMETAIAHLVNSLESLHVISSVDIAASLRSTADTLPPERRNREHIALVLRQIALSIEKEPGALGDQIRRLLH
jgi:hypothetical protein